MILCKLFYIFKEEKGEKGEKFECDGNKTSCYKATICFGYTIPLQLKVPQIRTAC